MIKIFIASKDRACQLDLLLMSIELNAPGMFEPTVFYTHSNGEYGLGYLKLIDKYKDKCNFILENNNAKDTLYDFFRTANDIVGLFTDDCVFYRKANFAEEDIRWFLGKKSVWSFNLRLGLNINVVDYVRGKSCPHPVFITCGDKFITWDYRFEDKFNSYFAFPTPFDGCFYNSGDLLSLADGGHFDRIIFWERLICHNGRQQQIDKNIIVAPVQSNVFAQQINSSHEYGHYTNNTFNISLDTLNKEFLNDKIIDINSMDFSNVNSCHMEIPFNFKEV